MIERKIVLNIEVRHRVQPDPIESVGLVYLLIRAGIVDPLEHLQIGVGDNPHLVNAEADVEQSAPHESVLAEKLLLNLRDRRVEIEHLLHISRVRNDKEPGRELCLIHQILVAVDVL